MTPPTAASAPSAPLGREPVGVIGLGLMGTALTERLLSSGFDTVVWNRTPEKAKPLLALGARWSDNPIAVCPRTILSLYTSGVVSEVLHSMEGGLERGRILIDTTTGEPETTSALSHTMSARGVHYLDAPISGSSAQTRRGEATVFVSGDEAIFQACSDLWPVLGARTFYVGMGGNAARMKLVSNLVLGLNRAVLAEALAFSEAIGIPPAVALPVLKGSNAYSRAMDVKGRKLVERDYSVEARLSQHLKDVRLMLDAAERAGLPLPLTTAHRQLLERAESAGWGDYDNSAILEVLRSHERKPAA